MKEIWNRWKKIAEKIGNIQAIIIFSLLYFILVTPFGVAASFFKDYLGRKSGWEKIEDSFSNLEKMSKQ